VLAPLDDYASLVFVNGSCSGTVNNLYNTDLSATGWSTSDDVAADPSYEDTLWPAVAAPATGPELVTAYVQQTADSPPTPAPILAASRTGGTWTSPEAITNATTFYPVALAPLSGSGALLAYEGTDGNLYTATFSGTTWSTPAAPFASSTAVTATPALAVGIGTALEEMVYLDSSGALYHTRLSTNGWSTATAVAPGLSGFAHVVIACRP